MGGAKDTDWCLASRIFFFKEGWQNLGGGHCGMSKLLAFCDLGKDMCFKNVGAVLLLEASFHSLPPFFNFSV